MADKLNTPMTDVPPVPSATSTPGGIYDENPAPAFGMRRSRGGLPVKMQETIGATPGKLDTPFTDAIELNKGQAGSAPKPGQMETPFQDAFEMNKG